MLPRILIFLIACLIAPLSIAGDLISGPKDEPAFEAGPIGIFEPANLALKISRLESRIAELEESQLDEDDVRRIAEDVFRKMSLTISSPGGKQRSEVVDASSGYASFNLAPGETLSGYTDPITGKYVRTATQTSGYRVASSESVVIQQVGNRATVSRFQPLQSAAGTCRIVNGRPTCN